jgi:hypothetical protein
VCAAAGGGGGEGGGYDLDQVRRHGDLLGRFFLPFPGVYTPRCLYITVLFITNGLRFCIYKYWLITKGFLACIYKPEYR